MAYQFTGFRATKPVVRLIDIDKNVYEVFFILYDCAGKRHTQRFKRGINCLPKGQRENQARAMASVLWDELRSGWNPLEHKYPPDRRTASPEPVKMTFHEAIDYALKRKITQLSKYSIYDYSGAVRFMKSAAALEGISNKYIDQFDRRDIRLLMARAKEKNKWSANARNKYLTILKSLLSVLEEEELIKINPAYRIKNEPVNEGLGYKRLSDQQKEDIAIKLMGAAPDFFDFLMFIYQAGIRRSELLQIRIGDINMQLRSITIRGEVAKTNRARRVPIASDMLDILVRRDIGALPAVWFLFSNNKFAPGEKCYHPNVPTYWWKDLVIDGMGIDCKMYSLKHKGADDKILAGLDIDALRTLYGHKSKQMTEIYAREVKNKYSQQIIDYAPSFAKVIAMKKAL